MPATHERTSLLDQLNIKVTIGRSGRDEALKLLGDFPATSRVIKHCCSNVESILRQLEMEYLEKNSKYRTNAPGRMDESIRQFALMVLVALQRNHPEI